MNVRNSDPQPSYDAFEAIAPRITEMHQRLITIFQREGIYGVTPWEIQRETGIIYNTVWRRLSELKDFGVIANTELTRPNDRAFQETVVVLRSFVSDEDYIPPRGTKSKLHKENQKLREENAALRRLLEKIYARWQACRDG
jgi:hypothetical protein